MLFILFQRICICFFLTWFLQCNLSTDQFFIIDENAVLKAVSDNSTDISDYCMNSRCGQNTICHVKRLVQYCTCKCGFGGNPYDGCNPLLPEKVIRGVGQFILNMSLPSWVSDEYIDEYISYLEETKFSQIYFNFTIVTQGSLFISSKKFMYV